MSPLTEAEKQLLLSVARQVVEATVRGTRLAPAPAIEGGLGEQRGAFVTLRRSGELRGCIGHIDPSKSLYETICECAMAAALADPRFEPVAAEEIPYLTVEISVLSPLEDISPDQIEIGRHGLLVSRGHRRGVLLPQVPLELMWDRERFLEETCRKAGLPEDAWRRGARVQAFTTQILAEPDEAESGEPQEA